MRDNKDSVYRSIIRLFNDEMSEESPFSLHHLVQIGEKLTGTKVVYHLFSVQCAFPCVRDLVYFLFYLFFSLEILIFHTSGASAGASIYSAILTVSR